MPPTAPALTPVFDPGANYMRTDPHTSTPAQTPRLTEPEDDVFDRRIGDVLDELYLERFQDRQPPADIAGWFAALTDRFEQLETTNIAAATDLYLAAVQLAATATGLATHLCAQEERDH